MVPAAQAASRGGLTLVRVAVAEALLAGGEAPVGRQAALTAAPVGPRHTGALTRQRVAEGVQRALRVALTGCKPDTCRQTGEGHTPGGGTSGPGSDLCSRWVRTGRWTEHSCRSSFPPRWGGTGTAPRWAHTRCSESPAGHTGILGNGVRQRRAVRRANMLRQIPREGVTRPDLRVWRECEEQEASGVLFRRSRITGRARSSVRD